VTGMARGDVTDAPTRRAWQSCVCKTSIPGSNPGGASKPSEEI
jgi:hypothetical protein